MFHQKDGRLTARWNGELMVAEPVGPNAVRIRATRNARLDDTLPGALLAPAGLAGEWSLGETSATIVQGRTRATLRLVPRGMGPALEVTIEDAATGAVLLTEEPPHILWPGSRHHLAREGNLWQIEQRFAAHEGERFWGLGQHQHGRFDQKGCVIDFMQQNTEITIPFVISSRGYAMLWNNPGIGRVELASNRTRWVADATPQIDYVVMAGSPAQVLDDYTALTGRPPILPDWALGFWQCKLRYRTQAEVLQVARDYRARGLPLDCLVIDFFHWTRMGEWTFNSDDFPDPSAMVAQLRDMGIEPMISVWPSVNANAETWGHLQQNGWLIASRRGALDGMIFYDRDPDAMNALAFYDATNPDARAFHWQRVRQGYVRHGFRAFWLDANEPEMYPMHPDNLRFHAGDGRVVANAYPLAHQTGYAEAMAADGLEGGLMLSRSAWAGSQRFPLVVWSGDVKSTFPDLARQIRAGLSMAMSGIAWWTTDIGGFKGGDIGDPAFHELFIRWFQFGCFSPVMRLHGFRQDKARDPRFGHEFSFGGADNEVWSFGPAVEAVARRYLDLRQSLRPYLGRVMQEAHETGMPVMRPLALAFPDDPAAMDQDDLYLLGPDLLVAPVLRKGAVSRDVYLPRGADWRCFWTGQGLGGGQTIRADAPLDRIPLFVRAESRDFDWAPGRAEP